MTHHIRTDFEDFICDLHARFSKVTDVEASWTVAQDVICALGGNALNIAVTSTTGEGLVWARSSMTEAWLRRYEVQNYLQVDPFVTALVNGLPEVMVDCGTLDASDPACALNHDLKAFGYGALFATSHGTMISDARSLVVFCSATSLAEVDQTLGLDRLRVVHAIIAAHIMAPSGTQRRGFLRVRQSQLSARECDILSWLACGLRNDEIAFKAGIAEVTVRKHLTAIRNKLGASTREQAIAIAIKDGWISI